MASCIIISANGHSLSFLNPRKSATESGLVLGLCWSVAVVARAVLRETSLFILTRRSPLIKSNRRRLLSKKISLARRHVHHNIQLTTMH
jgi:hypothetical protein